MKAALGCLAVVIADRPGTVAGFRCCADRVPAESPE
jgi:hypothetical protein